MSVFEARIEGFGGVFEIKSVEFWVVGQEVGNDSKNFWGKFFEIFLGIFKVGIKKIDSFYRLSDLAF